MLKNPPMDFNFRSINGRSSNYFPPPTNAAYFTEQALRAGFTSTEFRRMELQRNERHNVREAVHRELEKERIRAEIIAEEIARRRIIEEEVRRELILERELALRKAEGFPRYGSSTMRVDSRVPLRTNFESRVMEEEVSFPSYREVGFRAFETLPFQRHPLAGDGGSDVRLHEVKPLPSEGGKEKLISSAKPNISLSGLKRKAASPPPISAVELPSIGLKKKAKEEWSCALCQVSATSEHGLNEHLQGRKHKAKEAGLVAHRTGFGTGPLPKKTVTSASKPIKVLSVANASNLKQESSESEYFDASKLKRCIDSEKLDEKTDATPSTKTENAITFNRNGEASQFQKTPGSLDPKSKLKFWCSMCQVGANSRKVMNAHERGKKHLTKLLGQLNQRIQAAASTNAMQPAGERVHELHELDKEVKDKRKSQETQVKNEFAGEEEDEVENADCDSTGADNSQLLAAGNVAGEKEVEFEVENVDVAAEKEEEGEEEDVAAQSNSGIDSPSDY
ncbi:hypothetical protein Ancab_027642 [Ancistrocladus abbreviatus]